MTTPPSNKNKDTPTSGSQPQSKEEPQPGTSKSGTGGPTRPETYTKQYEREKADLIEAERVKQFGEKPAAKKVMGRPPKPIIPKEIKQKISEIRIEKWNDTNRTLKNTVDWTVKVGKRELPPRQARPPENVTPSKPKKKKKMNVNKSPVDHHNNKKQQQHHSSPHHQQDNDHNNHHHVSVDEDEDRIVPIKVLPRPIPRRTVGCEDIGVNFLSSAELKRGSTRLMEILLPLFEENQEKIERESSTKQEDFIFWKASVTENGTLCCPPEVDEAMQAFKNCNNPDPVSISKVELFNDQLKLWFLHVIAYASGVLGNKMTFGDKQKDAQLYFHDLSKFQMSPFLQHFHLYGVGECILGLLSVKNWWGPPFPRLNTLPTVPTYPLSRKSSKVKASKDLSSQHDVSSPKKNPRKEGIQKNATNNDPWKKFDGKNKDDDWMTQEGLLTQRLLVADALSLKVGSEPSVNVLEQLWSGFFQMRRLESRIRDPTLLYDPKHPSSFRIGGLSPQQGKDLFCDSFLSRKPTAMQQFMKQFPQTNVFLFPLALKSKRKFLILVNTVTPTAPLLRIFDYFHELSRSKRTNSEMDGILEQVASFVESVSSVDIRWPAFPRDVQITSEMVEKYENIQQCDAALLCFLYADHYTLGNASRTPKNESGPLMIPILNMRAWFMEFIILLGQPEHLPPATQ